jgi:hypothetical protein
MGQGASQRDGGGGAKKIKWHWESKGRSPNGIEPLHKQRKTAVDAGYILGDWLVQRLCWQKLREWGIIG